MELVIFYGNNHGKKIISQCYYPAINEVGFFNCAPDGLHYSDCVVAVWRIKSNTIQSPV